MINDNAKSQLGQYMNSPEAIEIQRKIDEEKKELAELLLKLFFIRTDVYAKMGLKNTLGIKKKYFYKVEEPMTLSLIQQHLEQKLTLGCYQFKEELLQFICFDFDKDTEKDFENAKDLYEKLIIEGFHPLFEFSGGSDYKVHIWIFCNKTKGVIALNWAKDFCKSIDIFPHEIFPKQEKTNEFTPYGNLVKLPLGKGLKFTSKFFYPEGYKTAVELLKYHLNNLDEIPIVKKIETQEKIETDNKQEYETKEEEIPETKKEEETKEKVLDKNKTSSELKYNEWQNFFDFVLNNEIPEGKVNDSILKNLAIYLWFQGHSIETLEEKIKPLYDSKGWDFTHLKGWFKKVAEGSYRTIARGEIVVWSKTYKPELLKLIPYEQWFIETDDIIPCHDHLPYFDLIDDILNLEGSIYYGIKKEIYNTCMSLAIPKDLIKCKIGGLDTDLRKNTLFFMPSGKGKLNTKEAIKKIFLQFKPFGTWEEPLNINKDQMLGKILQRLEDVPKLDKQGNKVYDKNNILLTKKEMTYSKKWGFLFKDIFCLEEVYSFLNSKDKNEEWCRNNLTMGLDIYGKNWVKKDNIDNADVDEETIAGYPHCISIGFCQPLPLQEELVTKGLTRRFNIVYRKFPLRSKTDTFKKRRERPKDVSKSLNEFSSFMKKINESLKTEWKFKDKEAEETFDFLHLVLLEQGFMQKGKKANYTSILEFPLQNQLLQFSCFKACANFRTEISKEDIEQAFIDIMERFVWELEFIETKVIGTLDYESTLSKIEGKKAECWEWLYNTGSTSEEKSNVTIELFQNQIMKILNRGSKTARNTYNELKKEGLIEDKRSSPIMEKGVITDHTPSKVWIKYFSKPVEEEKVENPVFIKPLLTYLDIISKLNHSGNSFHTGNSLYPPNNE